MDFFLAGWEKICRARRRTILAVKLVLVKAASEEASFCVLPKELPVLKRTKKTKEICASSQQSLDATNLEYSKIRPNYFMHWAAL